MSHSQNKPTTMALAIVSIFIIAGFAGCRNRTAEASELKLPPTEHLAKIEELFQEVATPGKIIRATLPNGKILKYVCTPGDVSVAVLAIRTNDDPTQGYMTWGPAQDTSGNKYDISVDRLGEVLFVTLLRGFSTTPSAVSVPYKLTEEPGFAGGAYASGTLTFTKISPAKRVLETPSHEQGLAAEKIAIAEFVKDHPGKPYIRVVEKNRPAEFSAYHILATSFREAAPWGKDNTDLDYETSSSGTSNTGYESATTAVKIRVDKMRVAPSEVTLTYKNAEIRDVNGFPILWFPTTQSVGTVDGFPATVLGYSEDAFRRLRSHDAHGDVRIELVTNSDSLGLIAGGKDRFNCIAVSPALDEMGLDWLHVSASKFENSDILKASKKPSKTHLSKIPELKLRFRLKGSVRLSSREIVLPVHHVEHDPLLFPPATTLSLSRATAGAGIGRRR